MNFIDKFLNSTTMYRLVTYGLTVLVFASITLSYFGKIGYGWSIPSLLSSLVVIIITCYFANLFFSKILKISVNAESVYITALIIFLIMPPASSGKELAILALVGLVAIGSKFLLAPFKKHIFNPTALAVFLLYLSGLGAAVWWVGDPQLMLFVLVVGLLVVRKIRRFVMFLSFILTWLVSLSFFNPEILSNFQSFQTAFGTILFFATIMMTEPITTPATRKLQIIYGTLNGLLLNLNFRFGSFSSTPEFVLLLTNIFSYFSGLKRRLILSLKAKRELAKDIYEFIFSADARFSFYPGQYLEWTLVHGNMDSRGNRRYFTIASSPTESDIKLGIKFNNPPSSFKNKLFNLAVGDKILAGQLGGDFVLPADESKKLVFLAGGIGVTPFRSMIKYLIDQGEQRDIILFYAAKSDDEVAYRDLFTEAESKVGLKSNYIIGKLITEELLKVEVPDYRDRVFYISGPAVMVEAFKKMLLGMGVSRMNINTDYFPGFV